MVDINVNIQVDQETIDAYSAAVAACNQLAIDVCNGFYPIYQQALEAVENFRKTLCRNMQPIIDGVVSLWDDYVEMYQRAYDCEPAYREYVVKLNWKRGRGKKLSWRRLNRQQRHDAIVEYLAKHGPFVL